MKNLSIINHQSSDKNSKGFTLVELLIAISIMAVLTVMGFNVYTGVQARARDAKRMDDLQQIKKALHLYHSSYGTFCLANTCGWLSPVNNPTYGFNGTSDISLKKTIGAYFNNGGVYDPKNPSGGSFILDYVIYIRDSDSFFLYANFETGSGNGTYTVQPAAAGWPGGTYNYRISESD